MSANFTSVFYSFLKVMTLKPRTLEDWILLMQATKEKYGNLDVKLIYSVHSIDNEEFSTLTDVMIHGSTSLLDDCFCDDSTRFVIVLD